MKKLVDTTAKFAKMITSNRENNGDSKMKASNKAAQVKALLSTTGSKFCSVTFTKKSDGSSRTITFNPKEGMKLVTGNNAQASATRKKNNPNIINVVDASIANRADDRRDGWRSFDAETVLKLSIGGIVTKFEAAE